MQSNQPHPHWCSPIICEATLGGAHTSNTHRIDADGQSNAFLQTRLWQPSEEGSWPLIEVVVGKKFSDGHRCRADISLAQALILHDSLDSLLTRAQPE